MVLTCTVRGIGEDSCNVVDEVNASDGLTFLGAFLHVFCPHLEGFELFVCHEFLSNR